MDWYVPSGGAAAVGPLRREIAAYLHRHAADGAGVDDAELIVAEVLGNAVLHSGGPSWVSVRWPDERPVLTVLDLGPGFVLPDDDGPRLPGADVTHGRGLGIIGALAERVEVAARASGGARVEVVLPVRRERQRSFDCAPSAAAGLPGLSEAAPGGGFGRESFLRALVVQLAQSVERQVGPDASEAAVAQVGCDVGAQMETEFRQATHAEGALTPEQLAAAYVRLKAAIGGDFRATDVSDSQVVLTNTRCPFGDVVTRAPALCRMTSSVFGGMAARNAQSGAAVTLEERIAVGDPQCRVIVDFDPDPGALPAAAHYYRRPGRERES
jgi:anti-sigma regulatory factor (Ser/Thr protein kinase)